MLGLSYGEIFLILGATAALLGPKDLPIIARAAGRLTGRAIGYVQLVRGQLENTMGKTEIRQMSKDVQDLRAQWDAVQHQIRSAYRMDPGPFVRTVMDKPDQTVTVPGATVVGTPINLSEESKGTIAQKNQGQQYRFKAETSVFKEEGSEASVASNLHSKATIYAKLAESQVLKNKATESIVSIDTVDDRPGLLYVLPVSAKCADLLPKREGEVSGSDIVLEAILEAEVARDAKECLSRIPTSESNQV